MAGGPLVVVAVMSLHRLSAGSGFRYLLHQTATADAERAAGTSLADYYAVSGNPPGRWLGKGLAGLGDGAGLPVGSVVSEAGMTAVFGHGTDPLNGTPLGRPYPVRHGPDGTVRQVGVAGFDLTFTVPKSVSILWGLGDESVRSAVQAAHHAALALVLALVEDRALSTRTGHDGLVRLASRGAVAAGFDHYDSRTGDPNLHTHLVIANRVQGEDGAWRAVDARDLHAGAVAFSETYDGLLADELTRRLPVSWGWRDRGPNRSAAFEVDRISDPLLRAFSTRAGQVDAALTEALAAFQAEHGRGPSRVECLRLRQAATLASRPAKTIHPLAQLRAAWADRAHAVTGTDPADLVRAALTATPGEVPVRSGDVSAGWVADLADLTVDEVLERRSTWTGWNLTAEAARALKDTRFATPTDRLVVLDSVVAAAQGQCVPLHDPVLVDALAVRSARWTHPTILDAEARLLAAATTDVNAPTIPGRAVVEALGAGGLSRDQAVAVARVAGSGRRVQVLVGPAGSGKTTTLRTLAAAWQAAHGQGSAIGLAPSATAAAQLSVTLGMRCENTAKWLHETTGPGARHRGQELATLANRLANTGPADQAILNITRRALQREQDRWRLRPGQLLIVDEASLAGTLTLDQLAQQAAAAGAKVLLVGDHHQLSAVEAGGVFGLLARHTHASHLEALWRFRNRWEAHATRVLRDGDPNALDAYAAHGRLHDGPTHAMLEAAYQGWRADVAAGRTALLIAADNTTVTDLNTRARADRIHTGQSSPTGVMLRDATTAGVGDTVITRHNNRGLVDGTGGHVRNGDTWTVTGVSADGDLTVVPADRPGRAVHLPAHYVAEHVQLGYAITVHRAQGRTVDHAHVIATPGMSREHLYVGLTRGRASNHAYVVTDDDGPVVGSHDGVDGGHHDVEAHHRGGPDQTGRDVLRQILATSSAEPSATETLAALTCRDPGVVHSRPDFASRPQLRPNPLRHSPPPATHGPSLHR